MPVFPSQEWIKAMEALLDKNPEYKKAGATWEGDTIMIIEAEEGLLPESFIYYSHPHHGEILESYQLKSETEKTANYVIRAPYSTFKLIIQKKLDPMKAMMTGKIKIKGDMKKLLQYAKFQQLGMEALALVETQFIDEV